MHYDPFKQKYSRCLHVMQPLHTRDCVSAHSKGPRFTYKQQAVLALHNWAHQAGQLLHTPPQGTDRHRLSARPSLQPAGSQLRSRKTKVSLKISICTSRVHLYLLMWKIIQYFINNNARIHSVLCILTTTNPPCVCVCVYFNIQTRSWQTILGLCLFLYGPGAKKKKKNGFYIFKESKYIHMHRHRIMCSRKFMQPEKPKLFTIEPFTEKVCPPAI